MVLVNIGILFEKLSQRIKIIGFRYSVAVGVTFNGDLELILSKTYCVCEIKKTKSHVKIMNVFTINHFNPTVRNQ